MLKTDKTNENYFDDNVQSQYQPTLICTGTQRRGTRVIVVLFILHSVASSMSRVVCLEGATPDFILDNCNKVGIQLPHYAHNASH